MYIASGSPKIRPREKTLWWQVLTTFTYLTDFKKNLETIIIFIFIVCVTGVTTTLLTTITTFYQVGRMLVCLACSIKIKKHLGILLLGTQKKYIVI